MTWKPEQYLKFAEARARPAHDLLARLDGSPARSIIVDLGCGTGHVTRLLAKRWPRAKITGVDSDRAMLATAAATAATVEIEWQRGEIASWQAEVLPDLIFSNAALHWLGDHQELLPRLLGQLPVGGLLAVQMPANFLAPSHQILLSLAAENPWHRQLGGVRMGSVLAAAAYHELLLPHCQRLELWETTYWQVLDGDDAVFEWMKGTTLIPYLARFDGAGAEAFLGDYRARLRAAYLPQADGRTLFPFKRIFFVAQR